VADPGGAGGPDRRRLFVAVVPPARVAARIADLTSHADRSGVGDADPALRRRIPAGDYHVTLAFVGDAPVEPVRAALAGLAAPPAELVLGPAVERLGSVLVVPVTGADALAGVVRSTLAPWLPADELAFVGHLTVARLRRNAAPAPVAPQGAACAVRFVVDAVHLITSGPGVDGPRYQVVASIPLLSSDH
jgi:2'-5' RNA ligase